jgi:putative flippase GtrA
MNNAPTEKIGGKIARWGKFNLVGAVGMAVQLGALALINRLAPGHYMVATAAAIEITLLHNFVWHLHYTWRDRFPTLNTKSVFRMGHAGDRGALAGHLIRFHLSNGLVSLAGNLALMPLLVGGAHIPVVAANAIAILCCSIVNFFLGDQWAFAESHPGRKNKSPASAGHPPLNATASPTQHE